MYPKWTLTKQFFVLQHLDKKTRDDLIELIGNDARRDIALISSFDDDQIGSKMTTNFVLIHSTLTIKQAMRELVNQAAEMIIFLQSMLKMKMMFSVVP